MLKLTRHFATRLRGVFATHTGTTTVASSIAGAIGVCEQIRLHLTSEHAAAPERSHGARERELTTERARLLVTLIGQNGRAVARCLGAFDAETLARPAGVLLLHLAERVGDDQTRRALEEVGAGA